MTIYLRDDFAELWRGRDPFKEVEKLTGKVYRELEGRRTLRFEKNGKGYFLKLHRGIGWKEVFKNLLQGRLPVLGASNEWLAIKKLEALKVKTMTAVAYGKRGLNPAKQWSFIITEALEPTISLEDFCVNWKSSPPSYFLKQNLLRRVAEVSRSLHDNGINHRDYYLCHFLLDKSADVQSGDFDLALIDLHRAQIRAEVPFRWRLKDIAGLYYSAMDIGLGKKDLYRFIRSYGSGDLRHELTENKTFWHQVQSKAEKLYLKDHGKQPGSVF